jgi:hypothetical protein
MKALVVVESVFGNTRQVAEAVVRGLRLHLDAELVDVVDAPEVISGVDLLVVGGPTHAFGMTRLNTRRSATEESGGRVQADAVGLREWLTALRVGPIAGASFDTRMDKPWLPGSAAAGAARRLRKQGLRMLAPPETFRVVGTRGPLRDSELDRATAWGTTLAASLTPQPA